MHLDLKKAFHGRQNTASTEGASHEFMHPMRDWMIVLSLSVSIFIGGVAYSMYDFYAQFGSADSNMTVTEKNIRYRDKEITTFSTTYTEKEAVFNALRADMPTQPVLVSVPETNTTTNVVEQGIKLAE